MKKFNKGIVITSTAAAALAALTFAGCANDAQEIAPKSAPASAVQAVKNDEAVKPVKAEAAVEKTAETTSAKKTNKKKSNKKKSAKASKKTAETEQTAQQNAQPAAQNNAQPAAQTQKTAEAPKSTQAPAVVIPKEVYPVWVEGDMYAGTYAEECAGRGTMEITRNSDGTYSVQVDWSSSAFEKVSWNFSGEFDGRAVLRYTNCRKTTVAFDENGNYTCDSEGLMTPYTTYTMGSGYIRFLDEGVLEWHDDMGDVCPGTTFVACKQSYNTKADEVGTAGSCYYESMGNTKADEVGTAGSCYYESMDV